MSIRIARNETSGWARARVSPTRSRRAKVARAGEGVGGRGKGGGREDKRERQSCAISKRPITSERSELEKMARENRDRPGAGRRAGKERVRASGWDEMEN